MGNGTVALAHVKRIYEKALEEADAAPTHVLCVDDVTPCRQEGRIDQLAGWVRTLLEGEVAKIESAEKAEAEKRAFSLTVLLRVLVFVVTGAIGGGFALLVAAIAGG